MQSLLCWPYKSFNRRKGDCAILLYPHIQSVSVWNFISYQNQLVCWCSCLFGICQWSLDNLHLFLHKQGVKDEVMGSIPYVCVNCVYVAEQNVACSCRSSNFLFTVLYLIYTYSPSSTFCDGMLCSLSFYEKRQYHNVYSL